MRILVVDDEPRLAENIRRGLEASPSFVVDVVHDGVDGEARALAEDYDAIVLDLMLPGVDGLTILRRLRAEGRSTPVLILTARSDPTDVVAGLDLGSDDYLAKPFDMDVLAARLRALVRRAAGAADPVFRVGELEVDTRSHQVRRGGESITLPALQYRLIEYLVMNEGRVVSKEELIERLYDHDGERYSNVIEVYVSALRSQIDRGHETKLIHTLRNQGYVVTATPPGRSRG